MAADDERARRIKELKNALKASDPTKTGPWIADQLGVSERSVAQWAATGAIGYPNCVRLAELIFEVDPNWLWRGPKGATPDLMATLQEAGNSAAMSQFDRIEAKLDRILLGLDEAQDLSDQGADFERETEATDPPSSSSSDGSEVAAPARATAGRQPQARQRRRS